MTNATTYDRNLNPENSPRTLAPVGVKRVNNWPLIILGIGLGAFLLIIMLVAADRSAQQETRNNAPAEQRVGRNATSLANDVTRGYEDGYVPAVESPAVESSLNDILAQQPAAEIPAQSEYSPEVAAIINQPSPRQQLPRQNLPDQEDEQARELRRRVEQTRLRRFEDAVTSRTGINLQNVGGGQSSGGNVAMARANTQQGQLAEVQRQLQATSAQLQAQSDPMAVYQARLQQLQNSGMGASGSGMGASPALANLNSGASRPASGYGQFEGEVDRWTLNSTVDAPQTPFVLRAGNIVSGVMISGVNSDLPGQILAQVSQDVFDTATGRHLLIPQGSRLVGQYASSVAYGQERVMVAWQRILFPDGKAMDIGAMQGADGGGYSGFKDQVNHHFWRIFGSAFLMSVVTAGVEMSQDNGSQDLGQRRRAGDALSEALGQQLGQATAQMIMRNLNIAPTIEIRPGYRFNVMVSKDMVFTKPYQSFDY